MSPRATSAGMAAGIAAVGASVPRGRLSVADVAAAWDQRGGKATLAVCGPDEDVLTLSWAAATDALDAAGVAGADVDGLWWGTAELPMAEGPSFAFLACALGLPESVAGLVASGSVHAGMDALCAACDALDAGRVDTALVIAADALVPGNGTAAERTTGSGAVAMVLRRGAPARVSARSNVTRPLLDSYRGSGQPGTGDTYDPRLFREKELTPMVKAACEALDASVARWSLPDPDGRLGAVVARAVGAEEVVSDGVQRRIGDTGCAAPFFGALAGMASPGGAPGDLGIVAFGGGRCSALAVEVASPVPGAAEALATRDGGRGGAALKSVSYASVLRARAQLVPSADPIPMGVPPGSAAFVRGNGELLGFLGRACDRCSAIAVPPSIHPVCPACGAEGGSAVRLARTGRVHTFVVNHTMPPPFEAPLPMCVVDLDDGARVMLQGMPDDAAVLSIGDAVEVELRRYALERGVPVYGFKVRRTAAGEASEPRDGLLASTQ